MALLVFPAIGVPVAMVWLWFTAGYLGIGRTGFEASAALVVLPLWAAGFGLFIWLPWRLIHERIWGPMASLRALQSGAAGGLLFSLIVMGPSSFTTGGGAAAMAYAFIVMLTLGGWVHNLLAPGATEAAPGSSAQG